MLCYMTRLWVLTIAAFMLGGGMAGRITALEPQKHSKERFNVYLDGEFAFGLADIEAVRLHVGDWLSDEEIHTLQDADLLERARESALNFLSYRPRSEAELRRHLRDHAFADQIVEDLLERLKEVGLVDDRAFASFWVENRTQFRPRGCRALVQELRQKGVPSAVIEDALVGYDEAAAAEKVAREQALRLAHLPREQANRRLSDRLARRGFSYDLIRDILTSYTSSYSTLEESEED